MGIYLAFARDNFRASKHVVWRSHTGERLQHEVVRKLRIRFFLRVSNPWIYRRRIYMGRRPLAHGSVSLQPDRYRSGKKVPLSDLVILGR